MSQIFNSLSSLEVGGFWSGRAKLNVVLLFRVVRWVYTTFNFAKGRLSFILSVFLFPMPNNVLRLQEVGDLQHKTFYEAHTQNILQTCKRSTISLISCRCCYRLVLLIADKDIVLFNKIVLIII